jgi:hypothetical protein
MVQGEVEARRRLEATGGGCLAGCGLLLCYDVGYMIFAVDGPWRGWRARLATH